MILSINSRNYKAVGIDVDSNISTLLISNMNQQTDTDTGKNMRTSSLSKKVIAFAVQPSA